MPYFLLDPVAATIVATVVGLCVGSFLNVVIHRLPRMLERGWQAECAELRGETAPEAPRYNLVVPRSTCPSCGHAISALENIPVLSWLALRGKCSACHAAISARYPVRRDPGRRARGVRDPALRPRLAGLSPPAGSCGRCWH